MREKPRATKADNASLRIVLSLGPIVMGASPESFITLSFRSKIIRLAVFGPIPFTRLKGEDIFTDDGSS